MKFKREPIGVMPDKWKASICSRRAKWISAVLSKASKHGNLPHSLCKPAVNLNLIWVQNLALRIVLKSHLISWKMCRKTGFSFDKGTRYYVYQKLTTSWDGALSSYSVCETELPSPDWTKPLAHPSAGGSSLPNLLYPGCLKGTGIPKK